MTIRKSLFITAAALLAIAPLASQAANDEQAMDACINAFVATNLPKEQRVTVRKEEDSLGSPVATHARSYKIVLSAKGARSGKYIARGTCLVDRDGTVLTLNGKALPTHLAAR